jgi:SOS-response transcriptional repressor LexA
MKRMAEMLPTTYEELVKMSGLISDGFAVISLKGAKTTRRDIIRTLDGLKARIAPFERKVPPSEGRSFGSHPLLARRPVPILDRIPAGFFDEANVVRDYDFVEQIVLTEEELGYDPQAFALHVKGDSMVEAGILEDDIVIVSPNTEVKNGDIAAVSYKNVDITLKKFHNFDDVIVLQPCNSSYPPVTIANLEDVKVLGKVILVRRKLF